MVNIQSDMVKVQPIWTNQVYAGNAYELSAVADGAYALPAYATMAMKANSTAIMHFMGYFINTSNAPVLVEFYEAATITGGTDAGAMSPINRNRSSTNTSDTTVHMIIAPTAVTGTLLTQMTVFAGANAVNFMNLEGVPEEWVLKPDTDYVVKIRNSAATATSVSARMLWMEV